MESRQQFIDASESLLRDVVSSTSGQKIHLSESDEHLKYYYYIIYNKVNQSMLLVADCLLNSDG